MPHQSHDKSQTHPDLRLQTPSPNMPMRHLKFSPTSHASPQRRVSAKLLLGLAHTTSATSSRAFAPCALYLENPPVHRLLPALEAAAPWTLPKLRTCTCIPSTHRTPSSSEDSRFTVYKDADLMDFINQVVPARFDFFYLRMDFFTGGNVRCRLPSPLRG